MYRAVRFKKYNRNIEQEKQTVLIDTFYTGASFSTFALQSLTSIFVKAIKTLGFVALYNINITSSQHV